MSNFDETMLNRLKQLEREVERLKVKESPGVWTAFSSSIGSASGAYADATAVGRYTTVGKIVHFKSLFTITNKGTAVGFATISLPVAPLATFREVVSGMSIVTASGDFYSNLVCIIGASNLLRIYDGAGNTPIVDGRSLIVTGTYEAA